MRLIDAKRLETQIKEAFRENPVVMGMMLRWIRKQPTADAAPVVHGRWGDNGIPDSMLSGCSVCGFTCGAHSFLYCPMCGAKMDGGTENGKTDV